MAVLLELVYLTMQIYFFTTSGQVVPKYYGTRAMSFTYTVGERSVEGVIVKHNQGECQRIVFNYQYFGCFNLESGTFVHRAHILSDGNYLVSV